MSIPVYTISIPEYHVKTEPNHKAIGKRIDDVLKKHFLRQRLAIRAISSKDHKGKSVDDLIKIVKKLGTDRYSPRRKGDRYENLGNKKIDLFALVRKVTPKSKITWQFIWSFYEYPKSAGQKPTRIDLLVLYDPKQLKIVSHTYDGKRIKRDGYVFRDQQNKAKALRGFMKVL
jgi:hypothetical protein